ncbi:MAG: sulfite exporter TauE/SafE family protein [Woeseia sp.]|jgi:uncharacterized protein|nr:sulfite exporter TauE/SafE family protein [Woeseia sp.]
MFTQDLAVLAIAMLATGAVGGVLAGLLGVGGGIVVVPVLEWVLELNGVSPDIRMHIAVATSLAVIIPTSLSSARAHNKRGAVDMRLAKQWTPFILIGAVFGTIVASRVGGAVLTAFFGGMSLLVAIKMALPLDNRKLVSEVPRSFATNAIPMTIGAISSMMGIGGGSLTVPALTLMNEPIHKAVGTSALFGLMIGIPGTLGFIFAGWGNESLPPGCLGFVNLVGMSFIAPTTVLAAPLGAKFAHNLSRRKLSLLFGLFLSLVAIRMIAQSING